MMHPMPKLETVGDNMEKIKSGRYEDVQRRRRINGCRPGKILRTANSNNR